MRQIIGKMPALLLVLAMGGTATGQEAPRLAKNSATDVLEAVDVTHDDRRIRHTIEYPDDSRKVSIVSSAPGVAPRLAIDTFGDSWVVWRSESLPGTVHLSRRTQSTDTWSPEIQIGDPEADCGAPSIIHHDGQVWIAYGIRAGSSISIVVASVIDNPEPIPSFVPVADTVSSGSIDLVLHAAYGALWMTWVEEGSGVCWVEHEDAGEAWSPKACQALDGRSIAEVRGEIRDAVTQP